MTLPIPNAYGLTFHHLGLAVKTPDDSLKYLKVLGYSIGPSIFDPIQKVNLCLCTSTSMPDVELVWPGDGPSPIDSFIKRGSGVLYHTCYTASDPAASIAAIEADGLGVYEVSAPKPAILFDGLEVSFHQILNVGLIEIIRVR